MFLAIAAGISLAATAAGMYETSLAEQARMAQLNIQEKQKELQLSQKKLSIYDQTKKVLERQEAQATTRGIMMNSPSFNAIQRDTFNISSKELANVTTESELTDYSFRTERQNVRMTTHAKLFGQVGQAAMSFASLGAGAAGGASAAGASGAAGSSMSSLG